MNDTYAKLIEMARTGSIYAAATSYVFVHGGTLKEALDTMSAIRKQTNWTRKDNDNAEEGKRDTNSD